jgi:hypothetical protein
MQCPNFLGREKAHVSDADTNVSTQKCATSFRVLFFLRGLKQTPEGRYLIPMGHKFFNTNLQHHLGSYFS